MFYNQFYCESPGAEYADEDSEHDDGWLADAWDLYHGVEAIDEQLDDLAAMHADALRCADPVQPLARCRDYAQEISGNIFLMQDREVLGDPDALRERWENIASHIDASVRDLVGHDWAGKPLLQGAGA